MDVGVDKAREGEPPVERPLAGAGRDPRRDLDDAAAGDADVDRGIVPGDPGVAQHEVERHGGILGCDDISIFEEADILARALSGAQMSVMAGLVPATPLSKARPCPIYRGRRDKPGDDQPYPNAL